ncbi:putative 3-methyladenine DNA glycosylase [Zafaria cholistanensis]|uniref:Putative 3-methyladenine DNA glycosylase n=1 Tax=Zafaria cholistanensis TaxID=1682741 RepID=A0A5A7NUA1_9MICC|nr:DNA-3-methyladenine glycosylase [Zafaria cholistanensis]GER24454.1 putative 3-methyladenine DNA glycosylase [Zafaria cholistanensis]
MELSRLSGAELLAGPLLEVAPALLGAVVTSTVGGETVSVRLTEVEGYAGPNDPGSHGFRGRTARNAALFGPPGTVYVYFTYGMHFCANIVCGEDGEASAVLLRAGEVVAGAETARLRSLRRKPSAGLETGLETGQEMGSGEDPGPARPLKALRDRDLASGPARLARSLGLTLAHNGTRLETAAGQAAQPAAGPRRGEGRDAEEPVLLLSGWGTVAPRQVMRGPRVGVSGPGGSESYPWRFWIEGEPTVSRYRPAVRRTRSRQPRPAPPPPAAGSAGGPLPSG